MINYFQRIFAYRLLVWAILSLSAGAWLFLTGNSFERGFGLQAFIWGFIDGGIALLVGRGTRTSLTSLRDLVEAGRKTRWLRRVLAVNAGLDLIYIAGGVALWLTLGRADAFNAGMGLGILVQGGFLLLFDALHALAVPAEIVLPDWHLFDGSQHASFQLEGGRPAAFSSTVFRIPRSPFATWRTVCRRAVGPSVGLLLPGFGA